MAMVMQIAKTNIENGERIEISTALLLPTDVVVQNSVSVLEPLVIRYNDLNVEQQLLIQNLHSQHLYKLQTKDNTNNNNNGGQRVVLIEPTIDNLDSISILPIGNIGMIQRRVVERENNNDSYNCKFNINIKAKTGSTSGTFILIEVFATRSIQKNEILTINLPSI